MISSYHMRSVYSISWVKNYIATGGADNRICVFEINRESLGNQEGFEYNVAAI